MLNSNKGYSLIEVMMVVGLSSILMYAGGALMTNFVTSSRKAEIATETLTEMGLGSKFLDKDFSGAGVNLNTTHVLDINGKEFFEYLAFSPTSGISQNEERHMILSLDTKKYPGAVAELVLLVTEKRWPIPLVFSPRTAYLVGSSCKEGNSLSFNGGCLYSNIISPEAIKTFGSDIFTKTSGAYYFFQIPQYFKNTNYKPGAASKGSTALNTQLISYSYLSTNDADIKKAISLEQRNFSPSSIVSKVQDVKQGNLYTTLESIHPSSAVKSPKPKTLDEYFKQVPFYAGTSTSFHLSKVRIIKYMVEKKVVGGHETYALYRINLKRTGATTFEADGVTMVSEGFEALHLSRKSISDPIVNIRFDRQFKVNANAKGTK